MIPHLFKMDWKNFYEGWLSTCKKQLKKNAAYRENPRVGILVNTRPS